MIGSFEFSDVIDDVVERSGGQQATATDVQRIRRGLRLLTERWLAQGFNTWRFETSNLSVSGNPEVILQSDVDDVIQVNSSRNGGSESGMTRISAVEYAQLATKTTGGQPSMYYLDRKDRPSLFVFPVGDASVAYDLKVYYIARPQEFDRYGDTTEDVPGRWLEALVSGLALDLARKRPLPQGGFNEGLIQRLKAEATEAEDLAQRADRGRQRYRYRTNYGR